MKTSAPAVSRSTTMSQRRSSDSSSTAPTSWSTAWASTEPSRRGRELVERRGGVAERSARAARDQARARSPASRCPRRRRPGAGASRARSSRGRWNTNVWQRERTVGITFARSVVQKTKSRWGGGSSISFSSAFQAASRELVRLVEDVDLVSALDRLEHDALADLPDVVDAALRGGVHFDDVERRAVRDRDARVAGLVRLRRRAVGAGAVERLREDARHRGLARSRAVRRRGTPAAPGRARSRSSASGPPPPARRPRRSPAGGTSGRAPSPDPDSSRWRTGTDAAPGRRVSMVPSTGPLVLA